MRVAVESLKTDAKPLCRVLVKLSLRIAVMPLRDTAGVTRTGACNGFATGVRQLRHDQMVLGPTELRAGCSWFLPSSGRDKSRYY